MANEQIEQNKTMTIAVSFKKHEKWLYDEIKKSGDQSNYVKDILKEYFENQQSQQSFKESRNENKPSITEILL